MWGPLLLENEGEGATHLKNLGLHWGRLHSLCGYFFMCLFRFLAMSTKARATARVINDPEGLQSGFGLSFLGPGEFYENCPQAKCSKSRDLVRLRFAIRIANCKSLAI